MKPSTERWLKRHHATMKDSGRYYATYSPLALESFKDVKSIADLQHEYNREKIMTIDMPVSKLENLIETEVQTSITLQHYTKNYDALQRMLEEKVQENLLCNKYEAVNKARENFRTLMRLVKHDNQ